MAETNLLRFYVELIMKIIFFFVVFHLYGYTGVFGERRRYRASPGFVGELGQTHEEFSA